MRAMNSYVLHIHTAICNIVHPNNHFHLYTDMTVQFTQPEDAVGEADGLQLLTANKRERISLHIASHHYSIINECNW